MWLMFNQMADDIPSEPRTDQTVVSLLEDHSLDLQHLMVFHELCLY